MATVHEGVSALSHPDESEFRCRWQWVEGSEWSSYCPMSKFHNEKQMDEEFRTTAKDGLPVPRLPTVKLPDGCRWEIIPPLGVCAVDDDGRHRHITQVFASGRQRRIDVACEAASQEIYGE